MMVSFAAHPEPFNIDRLIDKVLTLFPESIAKKLFAAADLLSEDLIDIYEFRSYVTSLVNEEGYHDFCVELGRSNFQLPEE